MAEIYTHIYDITGEANPIAVAVGPRTTEHGEIYIPSGPHSRDNKWPGAEHQVIEYQTLGEYKAATEGLEVWYEDDEQEVQEYGQSAWKKIYETEVIYRTNGRPEGSFIDQEGHVWEPIDTASDLWRIFNGV
jgi:hypothetical protein